MSLPWYTQPRGWGVLRTEVPVWPPFGGPELGGGAGLGGTEDSEGATVPRSKENPAWLSLEKPEGCF